MIHAIVQAFNSVSLQEYLKLCFQLGQGKDRVQFTVPHLCAAHMLKLVSMKLTKMQCKKNTKQFFLHCFALLQNATTFDQIICITKCMVCVFSSRNDTEGYKKHLSLLKDAIQTQKTDKIKVENADEDQSPGDFDDWQNERQKSLTKLSPFFAPIERVVRQAQQESEKENNSDENGPLNPFYCESLINVILHYAGTVPLWTGLLWTTY